MPPWRMKVLGRKFRPPMDLMDVIANFNTWSAWPVGLVLLLILVKWPTARGELAKAFRKKLGRQKKFDDVSHLSSVVFDCLQEVCCSLQDFLPQLASEVDRVKGPLYSHGLPALMQKLGILEKAKTGLQLSLGEAQNVHVKEANIKLERPIVERPSNGA